MGTVEERVAETINERGKWVWFGILPFYIRPITYAQLIDISAHVSKMKEPVIPTSDEEIISSSLENISSSPQLIDCVLSIIFRSRFMRFLFGGYCKHLLTEERLKIIFSFLTEGVDYGFFLGTIILLRGMRVTSPTKEENKMIAHGSSSVVAKNTTDWVSEILPTE